jgi:hypothetical protein
VLLQAERAICAIISILIQNLVAKNAIKLEGKIRNLQKEMGSLWPEA